MAAKEYEKERGKHNLHPPPSSVIDLVLGLEQVQCFNWDILIELYFINFNSSVIILHKHIVNYRGLI